MFNKPKTVKIAIILVASFVLIAPVLSAAGSFDTYYSFLPIVMNPLLEPTPIPTATIPAPTEPPVMTTGNIQIITIFANGAGTSEPDEYVEIRNQDTVRIQVQNWTLRDNVDHTFTFPSFIMAPGQTCRVYTNQNHPEYCSFNYGSGSPIWNNGGDCAYLRDSTGAEKSQKCY